MSDSMDLKLKKMLLNSCSIMNKIATRKCSRDFVDIENGCSWYHSVWQYLRVLNCVSAPQWHQAFYVKALSESLKNKASIRILISGTADYSFLHMLCCVLIQLQVKAHITIIDKCITPLDICDWYWDNLSIIFSDYEVAWLKDNITVITIQKDLLYYNVEYKDKYQIICSDSFLTRFHKDDVMGVLKKWKDLLAENGKIVTTVRIHTNEEKKNLLDYTKGINDFQTKVEKRFDDLLQDDKETMIDKKAISKSELLFMSYNYIIKMKSFSLGNGDSIKKLFIDCGYKLDTNLSEISQVEGEISETSYMKIVAEV